MGKINSHIHFTENVIKHRQSKDNTVYDRFRDSDPIFVTYYKQNIETTTYNAGYGDTYSYIGENSSVKYNKIKDTPLWGVSQAQIDQNMEDYGPNVSFESDGFILADLIEPMENDRFTINYMNEQILFCVIEVNTDTIKEKNYYKIRFKFESTRSSIRDEQIEETFNTIFDNIGTENISIIQSNKLNVIKVLHDFYDNVRDLYTSLYYNKKYNSFLFNIEGLHNHVVYNKYLTEFLIRHKLFVEEKNLYKIYLQREVMLEDSFIIEYKNTILGCIETKDIRSLENVYVNYMPIYINDVTSMFFNRSDVIKSIKLLKDDTSVNRELIYNMVDIELINNIISNIKFDVNGNILNGLKNIIIAYFNNEPVDTKIYEKLSKEFYNIIVDGELYIILPLILYIVDKTINNTLNNRMR